MVSNIIHSILQDLLDLLNTNFAQTIILIITACITWVIYKKQRQQTIKEAAAILVLQLDNMKNNFHKANQCMLPNNGFNVEKVWTIPYIFSSDLWEKYRQVLFIELSETEIKIINEFYEHATILNQQIEAFHNIIYATNEKFYLERMMKDSIPEYIKPHYRTSGVHRDVFKGHCEQAIKIEDKLPIEKLKDIAKGYNKRRGGKQLCLK